MTVGELCQANSEWSIKDNLRGVYSHMYKARLYTMNEVTKF